MHRFHVYSFVIVCCSVLLHGVRGSSHYFFRTFWPMWQDMSYWDKRLFWFSICRTQGGSTDRLQTYYFGYIVTLQTCWFPICRPPYHVTRCPRWQFEYWYGTPTWKKEKKKRKKEKKKEGKKRRRKRERNFYLFSSFEFFNRIDTRTERYNHHNASIIRIWVKQYNHSMLDKSRSMSTNGCILQVAPKSDRIFRNRRNRSYLSDRCKNAQKAYVKNVSLA